MFAPAVPLTGIAGYNFLQRTMEKQRAAMDSSPQLQREVDYFRENIGKVKTPQDLIDDHRLYTMTMEAFGLGEDAYKKAFVKRVLEEGTINPNSFANRLNDQRYRDMADAFSFDIIPRVKLTSFVDDVVARYRAQKFEVAVGDQDNALRLALYFERKLDSMVERTEAAGGSWLVAMGDNPIRAVLSGALGLPDEFAQLDIDKQEVQFGRKMKAKFGAETLADLKEDPEILKKVINNYLVREELNSGPDMSTSGYAALTLLQIAANFGFGASASSNLFASRF